MTFTNSVMNERRDFYDLDRFDWLKIWLHYWIHHPFNGGTIGLSFEYTGHAGKGLYPQIMMGSMFVSPPPLSFNDFAGLDRLRSPTGFGIWHGWWPEIYHYYQKHYAEIKL